MGLESEIYAEHMHAERRQRQRAGVDILARAHLFERRPLTVSIRDLTVNGFLMEGMIDVPVATTFYLQLPGLSMKGAETIWTNAQYTGCRFINFLSGAELNCIEDSTWRI